MFLGETSLKLKAKYEYNESSSFSRSILLMSRIFSPFGTNCAHGTSSSSSIVFCMYNMFLHCSEKWPEVTVNLDGDSDSATRNSAHADVCLIIKLLQSSFMICVPLLELQALLLIGQFMEDTAHFDTSIILKQYKVLGHWTQEFTHECN